MVCSFSTIIGERGLEEVAEKDMGSEAVMHSKDEGMMFIRIDGVMEALRGVSTSSTDCEELVNEKSSEDTNGSSGA